MSHQRRLSNRRGSVSASDPWGTHSQLNLNPSRSSSSTLTIVRVASPVTVNVNTSVFSLQEPPPSPVLAQRRQHRRISSNPPTGSSQDSSSNRLSFAFSSFAGSGPAPGGPASNNPSVQYSSNTAPGSPRLRPASPGSTRRPSFSKPKLTPDQLFDLARQSTNPSRHVPSDHSTDYPLTRSRSHSPVLRPQSPILPSSHTMTVPATFTPLPESVYLPFVDRPAEVSALISSIPTVKLFSLLAQTFPKPNSTYSPSLIATSPSKGTLPPDPTTWSFDHLCTWLTQVDRNTTPDALWVRDVRRCILARSELIWERVKGALGIPPELDVEDYTLRTHEDVFYDEDGDWDDWDGVENSPIHVENSRIGDAEMDDRHKAQISASPVTFSDAISLESQGSSTSTQNDPANASEATVTHPATAATSTFTYTHPYPYLYTPLSIEPLMADATATALSGMPPSSLSMSGALATDPGAGEGLQDIAEGAEEEEPEDIEQDKPVVETENRGESGSGEKELNTSLIHGLRISTVPINSSSLVLTSTSRPQSEAGAGSRMSSRSASFSSAGGTSAGSILGIAKSGNTSQASLVNIQQSHSTSHFNSPLSVSVHLNSGSLGRHHLGLKRSSSLSSSTGRRSSAKRTESFSSLRSKRDSGGWRDDGPYDPVTDRGPGNPLFPSDFARLALGPTLVANNSNLHSQNAPPPSMYAAGLERIRSAPQYAATFESESSVGEKD